jgi:SAM-dependent methyltransferase
MSLSPCNCHSAEDFPRVYGGRSPNAYTGLLTEVIGKGKAGKILDMGAGLGLFTELAYRWGLDVAGLEGSADAVSAAKARAPGIEMLVHDLGDRLPFAAASIAKIVLNQVIEHVASDRFHAMLAECFRVLEDDGRMFINSPSRRNIAEKKERTQINMLLPSELKHSLERAGFAVLFQSDHGLWFAPADRSLNNRLAQWLMRALPADWVSATANAVARKRSGAPAYTRSAD